MTNNIYTRSIALCLSFIVLSSCTGVRNDVERLLKPKVTENPYRDKKKRVYTPRTQTTHSTQEWAPTTRNGTGTVVQTHTQPPAHQGTRPSTPSPSDNKASDPMFAKPKSSPSTVTQVPTPPKPVTKDPTPPKPVENTTTTPAKPADKIYTVSLVANKPTHVYHPHNPSKIIRVTDANGIRYPSGTIMRVPGENIRFYVP